MDLLQFRQSVQSGHFKTFYCCFRGIGEDNYYQSLSLCKQYNYFVYPVMFEKLVERLLNQILGDYVQEFSKDSLNIGIWSGNVNLKNITLKKEIMRQLNLPFFLKFSRIGLLKLNIPWKSLTTSKIEVLLEGLEVVIGSVPSNKWDFKNTKVIEQRKMQVRKYCQSIINEFQKKAEAQKAKNQEDGYFSKLIARIVDNLQVTIKGIHVRFQDELNNNKYSFGVTLEELKLFTVNSEGKPEYVDRTKPENANEPLRKRFELYNIGLYWNQSSKFYDQKNYSQQLNKSIARRGQKQYEHHYIFLLTSQANLRQRDPGVQFKQPQIDLSLKLQTLKVQISNTQLQQIICLGQHIQKYKRVMHRQTTKELSKQEQAKKKEQFIQLFPLYYNSWGEKMDKASLGRLEDILEIMEVQNFQNVIKGYLQEKQKAKLIAAMQQKNRGWFQKPKDLSQKQMDDIQNFLDSNFGIDTPSVKRPKDYYYINVNFTLQKLALVIVNSNAAARDGIQINFDDLNVNFKMRQGGYKTIVGLNDIGGKMFKQVGQEDCQYTDVIYKLVPQDNQDNQDNQNRSKEYLHVEVVGSPPDKPHLDTDIKVSTSELMVIFYPKIITIATNFADLKISKENKEAALDTYGQYKEKTTTAVTQSIEEPVKSLVGIDAFLNSISLAVPLNPKRPDLDCWGLTLGSFRLLADQDVLKNKNPSADTPIDVYNIDVKDFSFKHYKDVTQFKDYRLKKIKDIDRQQSLIDDVNYQVALELYKQSTNQIPKLKVKAVLPQFALTINEPLYRKILRIEECFEEEKSEGKSDNRATSIVTEKKEIKDKASKIGMVHVKDSVTNGWKKYVAIMSENYIYLYNSPKDQKYQSYYYIKNATLKKTHEENDKEKPYYFHIKNSINEVTFGFDKPQLIEDWITKIKKLSKKDDDHNKSGSQEDSPQRKEEKKKDPNLLLLVVEVKISKIAVIVYTKDKYKEKEEENEIKVQLDGLYSHVHLHQSKKMVELQLQNLEMSDELKKYKNPDFQYFLKTQKYQEQEGLINVVVMQLDKDHPQYDDVASHITVGFGKLTCNYKCETVKALLDFFTPDEDEMPSDDKEKEEKKNDQTISEVVNIVTGHQEIFSVKLDVTIAEISVTPINQKCKIALGRLGLTDFKMYLGMSNIKMSLLGNLKELYFLDYSRYPNTIIQEQQSYEEAARYMIKNNLEGGKNMLDFDIKILQVPNQEGKKMLLNLKLNNLTVYYTQQVVLRFITYLNTQLLPSFDTVPTQNKVEPVKDTKPTPTNMELKVDVSNISVFVEPDPAQAKLKNGKEEYIQLNIETVAVRNQAAFRDYVQGQQKVVLVQNYKVQVTGLCIYMKYLDVNKRKHDYELTNKLNLTLSLDMISNPLYYAKQYKQRFKNGMRINCSLTPFVMRINQKDYSFVMKVLNWSITHDDGVDTLLYNIPELPGESAEQQQKAQREGRANPRRLPTSPLKRAAKQRNNAQVAKKTQSNQLNVPGQEKQSESGSQVTQRAQSNQKAINSKGKQNIQDETNTKNSKENKGKKDQPEKQPLYLNLFLDCLSLFVIKKGIPVAFLILDDLRLDFSQKEQMLIDLTLRNIYGTSVRYNKQEQTLTERGMFNAIGYEKKRDYKQKTKVIDELFAIFDRRDDYKMEKQGRPQPFLIFKMKMNDMSNYINIDIDEIKVDVDVKVLLILSTIANADPDYIKGPKPIREKKKPVKAVPEIEEENETIEDDNEEKMIKEDSKEERSGSKDKKEKKSPKKNKKEKSPNKDKKDQDKKVVKKIEKADKKTERNIKQELNQMKEDQNELIKGDYLQKRLIREDSGLNQQGSVRAEVPQDKPKMKIQTRIRKIQGSVADNKKEKFIMLDGEVGFSMTNDGDQTIQDLKEYFQKADKKAKLHHTRMSVSLKDFYIYFCKLEDQQYTNKRQILHPFSLNTEIKSYYQKVQQFYVETTDINLKVSKIMFFASMLDLLNLNIILQDTLKDLNNKDQTDDLRKDEEDKKKKNAASSNPRARLQQIEKEANKAVQQKMKLIGQVQPMQVQLVNDFNNNFMPVLRIVIQDIKPLIDMYLIKNHTMVACLLTVHFFNPRSSQWQPIIQPFKTSFDYLILDTAFGSNTKMMLESTVASDDPNDTGALKINVSSQMLETLLAAKEIAMKEKEKLQNQMNRVFDFIMDSGKEKASTDVEVSPIVIQNITNEVIQIVRAGNQFQLNPLYKGPVKFDQSQSLKFRLQGRDYAYSLDHYGTLKLGNTPYMIQFDIQKLNRVIRFISAKMIQNKMYKPVYAKRIGNCPDTPRKFQVDQYIPLDNIEAFSVSISGNSWTKDAKVRDMNYLVQLVQQKKNKFTMLMNHRKTAQKYDVYQLRPPFIIHNCLPKDIQVQFILKASTKHTKTIGSQASHQVCASENIGILQLRINIKGFGWSKLFRYDDKYNGKQRLIILEDQDGAITHINYVFQKKKEFEQYVMTIYCKKLVINQLKDKLIVYGNSAADEKEKRMDKYRMLGGQQRARKDIDDKVILIGQEVGNKLRICGVNSIFDFATEIAIGGIGQSVSRICVDRQVDGRVQSVFTMLGVQISLMKMSPNCDIFCTKIVIKSKGIIANNTSRAISIKQQLAKQFSYTVPAGKRLNTLFGLPQSKDPTANGYTVDIQGFQRSRVFHLPDTGNAYFRMDSVNGQNKAQETIYHKINIQKVEGYKFYQFTQIKKEQLPYEVRSNSPYISVRIPSENQTVRYGQSHFFIKDGLPSDKLTLQLQIRHEQSKEEVVMQVTPDDLNFRKNQLIHLNGHNIRGHQGIQAYLTFSDQTRTIIVDVEHIQEHPKERQVSYMHVNLPQMIISISQNSSKIQHPYESLVVTLKRFIFIMDQTDKNTKYQLKLGFMQIDQAYPHIIGNPVIITPNKFQLFTREEKPQSVFNSMIVINKAYKENTFIDQISVDFNDIVVKFSLDFLNQVTEVSKQFADIVNYENKSYYINKDIEKWQKIDIPKQGRKTFIKSIKISPFYIDLSAELDLKKLDLQNNQLLNTLLSAVGVVFSNIQDAPIHLSGMTITNCIDTTEGITDKIISQYKGDVISQFYKIFGSLNIIGNPMGLLRNIGTGFQDFTKKPAQGFVQGPAQFGKGIVQGTGSLVAHSVGGAFNSLSKITGTVSTGLATLSFDDQFEQHRAQQKMRKPKNVLQGLQKGGKAVLYGFKEGITGLFTQPYENAKTGGVLGFVKGAGKGLAGLVVKPVTGVIDFASKTTQGIKNNALMFEDRANEQRMRYPRAFYTECHILKSYQKVDAQVLYTLMKPSNDQRFQKCAFIDCFPADKGQQYIVILKQYLVYVDLLKKRVLWYLAIGEFKVQHKQNKKILLFKRLKKGSIFSSNEYEVYMGNDGQRREVLELLQRMEREERESQ